MSARRILVIEDNVDVATGLKYLLESGGREVAVAHDGATGIAMALRIHPQVVICDLSLPGQHDGFSVARQIRAARLPHTVYLVSLSGDPTRSVQQRSLDAGFDLHLTKPVELTELDAVLARFAS